MVIYDNLKKNTKVIVYSSRNNILEHVADEIQKEGLKIEKYDTLDRLIEITKKRKIKLIVAVAQDVEVEKIKELTSNIKIVSSNINELNIEALKVELYYNLLLIEKEDKLDFEKYKLEIVGELVESISHQVQANLLVLSASQNIIKMLNEDNKDKQKLEILDNLYIKNDTALNKSNMLLQLVSNAANLSSESIMHYDDIKDLIIVILDEYIKEHNVILNITERLKIGTYICGPLNDVIFVTCGIIKNLVLNGIKQIDLCISEDESNWYFEIHPESIAIDEESLEQIRKFVVYVKNVRPKLLTDRIFLIIKKVK